MARFTSYCSQASAHFAELAGLEANVEAAVDLAWSAIASGGKIMFCGNGGSAADCQHLAAELTGRYQVERAPLAGIALTVDSSALTAIGNDYGFEDVFARQLKAIGKRDDVLVAISTSGNSPNVLAAINAAKELGIRTIGLTGTAGGKLKGMCDVALCVPSSRTSHIQEMHIAIGHYLCEQVEIRSCQSTGQ